RDVIMALARDLGHPERVNLGARTRPAGDPPLIEADVTRLTTEVGFRPMHDLASGVRATLRAEGVMA
ncbi:MAG: hypothetical protein WAT77_14845, partial [Paracoccaceae bacterium]